MFEQRHPEIEDEINELLDGELKENALKFIIDLNEQQLTPKLWKPEWARDNFTWKISCSECSICMIQFEPNKWRFTFFFGDYSGEFEEAFVTSVQEHVKICTSCHDGCTSGIDTVIFGKEYKNVCSQLTIQFENPNNKTLEHIKKMIKYCEKVAPNSESWHAHN